MVWVQGNKSNIRKGDYVYLVDPRVRGQVIKIDSKGVHFYWSDKHIISSQSQLMVWKIPDILNRSM